MRVGELIKELAQYDFDMNVEIRINNKCQVDVIDLFDSGIYPYKKVVIRAEVDTDELTEE